MMACFVSVFQGPVRLWVWVSPVLLIFLVRSSYCAFVCVCVCGGVKIAGVP
jgi:hypothetical protein